MKIVAVMTGVVDRLDETFRRVARVGDELVEGIATNTFQRIERRRKYLMQMTQVANEVIAVFLAQW